MDKNNPYSSRIKTKIYKEFNNNETYFLNTKIENEFFTLVNSLTFLIKEYYMTITKIIKDLKMDSFELNKYILTSKCLINEMNSKSNLQERIKIYNKKMEDINLYNKYINNNISLFEFNLNKLLNDSKIIFKKMEKLKLKNLNTFLEEDNHNINSINTNNNKNQIILEQNNINHYNNKINCLKLSLDTNKLNSFSNTNKSIANSTNRKILYSKKDKNKVNASQKNIKHKKFDISLGNLNYLEKNIEKDKNKYKTITNEKCNSYRNRNCSQNNIITDLPISNINKIKYLFKSSPLKQRISLSNEKITPLCTNYSNFNYYSNKNKNSSSGYATSRISEQKYHNQFNNFKTIKETNINIDSSFSENYNNNLLELLENIIEYFYLLSQFQYCIISKNQNIYNNNNILLKLNKSINTIKNLFFINNDILKNNNILKQKLFTIIKQNESMNQNLKILISKINNKNNTKSEKNFNDYETKNTQMNNNSNYLKNSLMSDYNNTIEKLKIDNKKLGMVNKDLINYNKLLIQKLNLIDMKENINSNEYNKKLNLKINQLIKENKDFKFQINNLQKDNKELLKIIKNKNNTIKQSISTNSDNLTNKKYYLDNLDYNIDKDNNFILSKKNNQIKELQSLLDESKLVNINLIEIEKEKDNKIKILTEQITSLNNKYNINITLINEKNSIIEELNITITKLKTEINNNKNKYTQEILSLKEQTEKNNNIKDKEILDLKKIIEKNKDTIDNINKDKSNIENELNNMKEKIKNKNNEIEKLNNKHNDELAKIKINENNEKNETYTDSDKEKKILEQKDMENNILKEKIIELENINKNKDIEHKELLKISKEQTQEINQLESIINVLKEKMKDSGKNKTDEEEKIDIQDIENDIINYKDSDEKIDNKNDINESNAKNKCDIEFIENNNETQSKRLSTPSFKSPELDEEYNFDDNLNVHKKENISEIKKLNELLLRRIREYESMLKINDIEIEEKNDENNINNDNDNNNNINGDKSQIKYFQNKYIHYLGLYKDYKRKCETFEKTKEKIKSDLSKAKTKINELSKKLKDNNIFLENNNNYVNSLSSLKLHNQYNSNEYIILCDKTYRELKWFLMKKKYNEDENESEEKTNAYDNLIWVPIIDVVDLDNFNQYSNDEEKKNNIEMLNIFKKLEEKEDIISKLSYKLEKLEKDYNNEQNIKFDNKIFHNSIPDNISNIYNENEYMKYIRKESSSKSQRNERINENGIPIEKFNNLLEKLNQTEARFVKLQKENTELKKYQKLYFDQSNSNNNPINNIYNKNKNSDLNYSSDINKMTFMESNLDNIHSHNRLGLINNNEDDKKENKNKKKNNNILNQDNQSDEDDYYRKKYNELEMKLKILKDACKNILIRLTIPKKDREEIKQILKLFEFSEEETLIIIGDKKK